MPSKWPLTPQADAEPPPPASLGPQPAPLKPEQEQPLLAVLELPGLSEGRPYLVMQVLGRALAVGEQT